MPLAGWFAFSFLIIVGVAFEALKLLALPETELLALVFLLLALFLVLLQSIIAGPVRRLARAVKKFAERGERTPIPMPRIAPKEIRTLVATFAEMAAKVETAHQRDQEVSRVKSDFISTAAHQLRTPLTGIRWALEALDDTTLTEEQRAIIKDAAGKSRDLVGIVSTLLDISAIESGKYRYQFARIEVPPLLTEIVQDFVSRAKERQLTLLYAGSEEALPTVRADKERIKWLLNNLVENALAYTPAGGSVHLSAEPRADKVLIHVRDTGIGISAADRGNIFERFFRGANAINKENEGNGLGLYIARTIATDHGGDLTFTQNPEGPGTQFTLSLPSAA